MKSELFGDADGGVFKDSKVLKEDYHPETIENRDDEIASYQSAMQPVFDGRGGSPDNILVYGKAGVGKTAVTRYVTEQLKMEVEHRYGEGTMEVIHHNCNGDSVYDVFRNLTNHFRGPHEKQFPERGLSLSNATEAFYTEVNSFGGDVVVVLDEIDHINDSNPLLYELSRANDNNDLGDSNISLIGISNNLRFKDSFSSKVSDSLKETSIKFKPYDANELSDILLTRAEKGLKSDVYSKGIIRLIAALTANDEGSARQAIDVLNKAAKLCMDDGRLELTEDDVHNAKELVERREIASDLDTLTDHGQYVLSTVISLDLKGETPCRSKTVFETYKQVLEKTDRKPLTTLKSIQNHLNELQMLGFLHRTKKNEGLNGGVYAEYECTVDPEQLLDLLEKELDITFSR
ncbi:orc1/cdc6 family replication initiation protein [Halogranum amylolyticum]|uniref:ORC1-type DNA replication protein n=1 Tax=Halogranum amylolyticum TaxID=660520 RepID=A0A1H8WXX8_9EURY|nr:AAA family ATPase [Halogranum amylolyticum]SEP32353.1 orc1/cdc6 family replication initiation protein [Halogranum amylolyticum]